MNVKASLKRNSNAWILTLFIVAFSIVIGFLKPTFFSLDSFVAMAKQFPEIGLFTFAIMLPMLVGGIDLSIIASANLAAILMSLTMNAAVKAEFSNATATVLALLVCVVVCVFVGFLNGVIIATLKIPAMLVTLGMQMMLTGISLGITKGGTLSGFTKIFKAIGNKRFLEIPNQFWIFLIAAAALLVIMQMTPMGIKLKMYGSNPVATRYSGVNDKALLIQAHSLSGFYVALAAIIMTSRLNAASAATGNAYLMRAILIAVLGGVNPNGGEGKVSGVLLGTFLFQIVATGLNVLKVNSYIVIALYGAILLLVIMVRNNQNA